MWVRADFFISNQVSKAAAGISINIFETDKRMIGIKTNY
jgi:hypothetical protein